MYRFAVLAVTMWGLTSAAQAQYTQQTKLVAPTIGPNRAIGNAQLGHSVAISVDHGTALVGGPRDNGGFGAAWVWTNDGGQWVLTAKLVSPSAGAELDFANPTDQRDTLSDGLQRLRLFRPARIRHKGGALVGSDRRHD